MLGWGGEVQRLILSRCRPLEHVASTRNDEAGSLDCLHLPHSAQQVEKILSLFICRIRKRFNLNTFHLKMSNQD